MPRRGFSEATSLNTPRQTDRSTPISETLSDDCPEEHPDGGVPEALYVIDLTVETGGVLETQRRNVYDTGTLTDDGTIESSGSAYTPIQLTPTLYGNFDGEVGDGTDEGDMDRFNAA